MSGRGATMTFVSLFEGLATRLPLRAARRRGRADEGPPHVPDPYRALYPPQPESERRVRAVQRVEERPARRFH